MKNSTLYSMYLFATVLTSLILSSSSTPPYIGLSALSLLCLLAHIYYALQEHKTRKRVTNIYIESLVSELSNVNKISKEEYDKIKKNVTKELKKALEKNK